MENIKKIINELAKVPDPISKVEVKEVLKLIHDSGHIFISGAGRSGLMIESFANRLLQIGMSVSVVGEITSPHTQTGDLLIFNSASGKSQKLIAQAKVAIKNDVETLLITTDSDSPLAEYCKHIIVIKAQSKYTETSSVQPMGALFEQYSMIFFDSLILDYMFEYKISEQTMINNHADIE